MLKVKSKIRQTEPKKNKNNNKKPNIKSKSYNSPEKEEITAQ